MKVFKMNDCDWVAAASIAEAVQWYEDTTGFDWVEDPDDINPVEWDLNMEMEILDPDTMEVAHSTMGELIDYYKDMWPNNKDPYVILSTEY